MGQVIPSGFTIENRQQFLEAIIKKNAADEQWQWLKSRLDLIIEKASARDFFLTFSLSSSKFSASNHIVYPKLTGKNESVIHYLEQHDATLSNLVRLFLLVKVLDSNAAYFANKIIKLMEASDREELAAILKFLVLLPEPEVFKLKAVDSIRTNMTDIFDAIALDNPYPAMFFDDLQWNQLYLKAAFMQRPLSRIMYVDERANLELSRMINDFAKERWSAGREVDPLIWRPVSGNMNNLALKNMKSLLQSNNLQQQYAGALCCFKSDSIEAANLLAEFDLLNKAVATGEVTWQDLETEYISREVVQ